MNTARSASRSPPSSRPGTAGNGGPWVPPGVRPHTLPNPHTTPMTGTRRNRAVERTHVFLDSKELSPRDPGNYFWLYGAYEYRLQTPHEEAKAMCFRHIDRLVEKARQWYDDSPPLAPTAGGGAGGGASHSYANESSVGAFNDSGMSAAAQQHRLRATSIGSISDTNSGGKAGGNNASTTPKAHLIWDLISTKKHIGPIPEEGLPQRLGHDIYRYVDTVYGSIIATTFVGLTDNTARRVGRDVYYTKTDDLSRTHYGFHTVDREHLFIVFPPAPRPEDGEHANHSGAEAAPRASGGGGNDMYGS
ncbi:Hypothetical protein, putative [Bodo saltans]|uniref:Uncharacterized protein n=1 Tax=Bodo saltans TaxID=75058 RepID=A0A0S4J8X7_BODSA|nr:Hypothetical protein, putative [Bodo saltans]|eukprot:CUG86982.1 Hypothetical protein, putative [Bodo saltans]